MNCGGDGTTTAKYLHAFNNQVWKEFDPMGKACRPSLGTSPRIKKKVDVKPKKEKDAAKQERGIRITNRRITISSFLIPIFVTGEKKDYQFLYCICALKNALKILSTTLRKEGFAQLYMVGMKKKVDWKKVKENRTSFSDIITEYLFKSGAVCMVAVNRKEEFRKVHDRDAPFIVVVSASDINLPCQENLCVGTSWLIYRRTEKSRELLFDREIYHSGRRAIHAGILVNGCTTSMTVCFKRIGGIHHFIHDRVQGDFKLFREGCFLRQSGNIISLNEGLFYKYSNDFQKWLMLKKLSKKEYHSRYTGGWLTDCFRILRSGGILLSPKDSESLDGRIRFFYLALPMAYLAEKAGGKATDGRMAICKMRHKRTPFTTLVLGSIGNVDSYLKSFRESSVSEIIHSNNESGSDETSTDFE